LQISLSDYTGAWQLYVGLMFVLVVMFVPGGLAGVLLGHLALARAGTLGRVLPAYALAALPLLMVLAGLVLLIETSHHLMVKASEGSGMSFLGLAYDATSPIAWGVIALLVVAGFAAFRWIRPIVSQAWHGAVLEAQQRRAA
jgi:branched-chain amino acid transport system permease protein